MYLSVLIIVYFDKIFLLWKKNIFLFLSLAFLSLYGGMQFVDHLKTYAYRQAPILKYLSFEKLPQLVDKLGIEGKIVIQHFNRASSTLNELIFLSLGAVSILLFLVLFRYYKGYTHHANIRFVAFLFITSSFILIPIAQYTAGMASLLTYQGLAYRFYFSSLLFLVIPIFIFYILRILKINNVWMLNLGIFFILFSTFIYSKYDISHQQNYYRNISSIKNAFSQKRVGFNLSDKNIAQIGKKIKYYESIKRTNKKEFYYARDDIAFVIKFIYQKPVLYTRRGTKNYLKSYHNHRDTLYYPVLFDTPKGFPKYERYK